MKYFLGMLLLINLVAFIVWCADKYFAVKSMWRVPEKVLFALAILGGSVGSLIAMHTVRHKTRHWYFVLGIPLIIFLQVALAVLIIKYC